MRSGGFDADDVARRRRARRARAASSAPGADLKAMREPGAPRASRVEPDGDGPVGPTRMLLTKPVIAAVEGHAVGGRAGARRLVRPARRRRGRGVRRLLPPLGHPADGRRHDPARAADRAQPRARPDPHRPRRQRRGGARDGPRQPRSCRRGEALEAAIALAHEIAAKPQAALRSDRLSSYEQWSLTLDEALANEYRARHGDARDRRAVRRAGGLRVGRLARGEVGQTTRIRR